MHNIQERTEHSPGPFIAGTHKESNFDGYPVKATCIFGNDDDAFPIALVRKKIDVPLFQSVWNLYDTLKLALSHAVHEKSCVSLVSSTGLALCNCHVSKMEEAISQAKIR